MAGLASLLSRRTMNPRAAGAAAMRRNRPRPIPRKRTWPPPGGHAGGHVKGYQMGGRTMNPRAAGAAAMLRNRPPPREVPPMPPGWQAGGRGPRGWQEGGPVGAAPEEVEMAAEIYAMATPEQQDQITGGGGGPGMMDEEAAIGEALAMAMGGGGGGPPMMGGPPMNGAPPMGGLM